MLGVGVRRDVRVVVSRLCGVVRLRLRILCGVRLSILSDLGSIFLLVYRNERDTRNRIGEDVRKLCL